MVGLFTPLFGDGSLVRTLLACVARGVIDLAASNFAESTLPERLSRFEGLARLVDFEHVD